MGKKITVGSATQAASGSVAASNNSPLGRKIVATRAMYGSGYDQQSDGSTETSATTRMKHLITADCKDIVLVFGNFNSDTNTQTTPITVRAAWDDGSTVYPLFFNGKRDITIDAGGIAITDPFGAFFYKGDAFNSRSYVTCSASQKWPKNHYTSGLYAGEGVSANTDATLSTVASWGSGTSQTFAFAPLAIMGTTLQTVPCIALVGDSIQRDGSGSTIAQYGVGLRSLGANHGQNYCSVLLAQSGSDFTNYTSKSTCYRKLLFASGCTHVLSNMGVNALFSNTLAFQQTNTIAFWRLFSRMGLKVYQTTVSPRTTSTDSWATTANQTIYNSGVSVRIPWNNWLRDGAPMTSSFAAVAVGTVTAGTLRAGDAEHPLAGYFECADTVETARNSGIWKANYTVDGIHPYDVALNVEAAAINPALFVV